MSTVESHRQVCLQAAETFVEVASSVPRERLDDLALEPWTNRALVAHGVRVLDTLVGNLDHIGDSVDLHTPGAYYNAVKALVTPDEFRQGGQETAAELGEDPQPGLKQRHEAFVEALDAIDPDADPILATPAGSIRLSAYLPVVTAELVTHALDLAHSIEVDVIVAADALRQTLQVFSDLAVLTGRGQEIALALRGRDWAEPRLNLFA